MVGGTRLCFILCYVQYMKQEIRRFYFNIFFFVWLYSRKLSFTHLADDMNDPLQNVHGLHDKRK